MTRKILLLVAVCAILAPAAAFAAPANDNFANRAAISGSTGNLAGSTVDATFEDSEPCYYGCYDSVWYSWTGPRGVLTVEARSDAFDAAMSIYTGGSLPTLRFVDGQNDSEGSLNPRLVVEVKENTTYHIQVMTQTEDTEGAFTLVWSLVSSPANDDFAAAQEITGVEGTVNGSVVAATFESNEPCYYGCYNSVWYKWRAPAAGRVIFTVTNTTFNPSLAIYQGNAMADVLLMGADDDSGNGTNPLVSFVAEDGVLYRIQVTGNGNATSPFKLNWLPGFRPDAQIKLGSAPVVGNNVYNTTAASQTVTTSIAAGGKKTFVIKVQNDGAKKDSFKIKGPGTASGWKVVYLEGASGSTNITSAVTSGTYTMSGVGVGSSRTIRMVVTRAGASSSRSLIVSAASKAEKSRKDAVKAVVNA